MHGGRLLPSYGGKIDNIGCPDKAEAGNVYAPVHRDLGPVPPAASCSPPKRRKQQPKEDVAIRLYPPSISPEIPLRSILQPSTSTAIAASGSAPLGLGPGDDPRSLLNFVGQNQQQQPPQPQFPIDMSALFQDPFIRQAIIEKQILARLQKRGTSQGPSNVITIDDEPPNLQSTGRRSFSYLEDNRIDHKKEVSESSPALPHTNYASTPVTLQQLEKGASSSDPHLPSYGQSVPLQLVPLQRIAQSDACSRPPTLPIPGEQQAASIPVTPQPLAPAIPNGQHAASLPVKSPHQTTHKRKRVPCTCPPDSWESVSSAQKKCPKPAVEGEECSPLAALLTNQQTGIPARKDNQIRRLPASFRPSPYTVIIGRGKKCSDAIGNRRCKVTAQIYMERYGNASTKTEKNLIVSEIVDIFRDACPEGLAFVRQCEADGYYVEASDLVVREKVGSYLRDCLDGKYRSSCKRRSMVRRHRRIVQRLGYSPENGEEEEKNQTQNGVMEGGYTKDEDQKEPPPLESVIVESGKKKLDKNTGFLKEAPTLQNSMVERENTEVYDSGSLKIAPVLEERTVEMGNNEEDNETGSIKEPPIIENELVEGRKNEVGKKTGSLMKAPTLQNPMVERENTEVNDSGSLKIAPVLEERTVEMGNKEEDNETGSIKEPPVIENELVEGRKNEVGKKTGSLKKAPTLQNPTAERENNEVNDSSSLKIAPVLEKWAVEMGNKEEDNETGSIKEPPVIENELVKGRKNEVGKKTGSLKEAVCRYFRYTKRN